MPNGFGASILDGCSFADVLTLAGGYLIDPTPSRPPSPDRTYRRRLAKLMRMPVGRALPLYEREARAFHDRMAATDKTARRDRREKLALYRAMRAKVRAWNPPKALVHVKRMMLQQISGNVAHDCRPVGPSPALMSGAEYLAWYLDHLKHAARLEAANEKKARQEQKRGSETSRAMVRELEKLGALGVPAV